MYLVVGCVVAAIYLSCGPAVLIIKLCLGRHVSDILAQAWSSADRAQNAHCRAILLLLRWSVVVHVIFLRRLYILWSQERVLFPSNMVLGHKTRVLYSRVVCI